MITNVTTMLTDNRDPKLGISIDVKILVSLQPYIRLFENWPLMNPTLQVLIFWTWMVLMILYKSTYYHLGKN